MYSFDLHQNNDLPNLFQQYILENGGVLVYQYPQLHQILGVKQIDKQSLIIEFIGKYMNTSANDDIDEINKQCDCYSFQYEMINYLVNKFNINKLTQVFMSIDE